MKNLILLLPVLLLFSATSSAQKLSPQIISSAGEEFKGSQYSLAWTIGEPVVTTLDNNSIYLTQGFHQGYHMVTSIDKVIWDDLSISVYPIPANEMLFIQTKGSTPKDLVFEILDLQGKKLMDSQSSMQNNRHQLQIGRLPNGIYLLRVVHEKNSKVFKIIKN